MCTLVPHAFCSLHVCWHGVACSADQHVSMQSNGHREHAGMEEHLYAIDCQRLEAQQYMHRPRQTRPFS